MFDYNVDITQMRRRLISLLLWMLALAIIAAGVAIHSIERAIARQSTVDEARPADVIVVLGAAEYRGRPSPVLEARLNHALFLYRLEMAPRILTTGGAGGDPTFTEGEVARAYLSKHGVPSEAIMVESEGESTVYSTAAAAEIMRRMSLKSCIVVSDGYHIYRVKKMLESQGMSVYGSPRPAFGTAGQLAGAMAVFAAGDRVCAVADRDPDLIFPENRENLALNRDGFKRDVNRLHGRVGGLQTHAIPSFQIEALERGLHAVHQGDHDIAVARFRAALHQDEIAVADLILNHRFSAHLQGERARVAREIGETQRVVSGNCFDGSTRCDASQKRHFHSLRVAVAMELILLLTKFGSQFQGTALVEPALDVMLGLQRENVFMCTVASDARFNPSAISS